MRPWAGICVNASVWHKTVSQVCQFGGRRSRGQRRCVYFQIILSKFFRILGEVFTLDESLQEEEPPSSYHFEALGHPEKKQKRKAEVNKKI